MSDRDESVTSEAHPDWLAITKVKRDICFFYHEQLETPGIDGDLAFSELYNISYWKFLNLYSDTLEREFIQHGCLLLILAMAWDIISGSGWYLRDHLDEVQRAVADLITDNPLTTELASVVLRTLARAGGHPDSTDELLQLSAWAKKTFILSYFSDSAKFITFDS